MEFDKENIIDAEFKEDTYTKYINGKPLYYKTSEVAEKLGETDSTVRFWCSMFSKHLPIETSGRNRKFKDGDIEKLKFIQKLLRNDGLSIQQVNEYLSEPNIENKLVKESEPLPIQMVATATAIEVGEQLNEFIEQLRTDIIQEIKEEFKQQQVQQEIFKEEIKEHIAVSIDEKMQIGIEKIQNIVDALEVEAKKRDEEKLDILKKGMEEREKLNQELEQQKKKGLFGWFKK